MSDSYNSVLRMAEGLLRRIPRGTKGKERLARWLLSRSLPGREKLVRDAAGCVYHVPDLKEPVAFGLLVDGGYELDVLRLIKRHLPQDGMFLDVGANIGAFTVAVAKVLKEGGGRVLAIEASPEIFGFLRRNCELNHITNAEYVNLAAANGEGQVLFYPAPADHFGMGSLAPQFDAQPIAIPSLPVDVMLRQRAITRVDVMKIDVEGFEAAVLQGAQEMIRASEPLIIFEFADWAEQRVPNSQVGAAQRFLAGLGYDIWTLEDFVSGRSPLETAMTEGGAILVGAKRKATGKV